MLNRSGIPIVRDFSKNKTYAIVICFEKFYKLRQIERCGTLMDLPWVKNDLINARITVENLGIPSENVFEFVDKPLSDDIVIGDSTWFSLKEFVF